MNTPHANNTLTRRHWLSYCAALLSTPFAAIAKLRALGVSSRRTMFGIASMREQGLDAEMSNWRAVFTGRNLPAERSQQLLAAIDYASNQDNWKQALVSNNWSSSWQTGKALQEFLEVEASTAQLMTYLLKLKS